MVSKFDLGEAEHMFYHLAAASNKLAVEHEIKRAIEERTGPRISVKKEPIAERVPKKLTKHEKELISKLKKQVTSINKKIKTLEKSGKYDVARLHRLQVKVKIIRNRIRKIEIK